jgi:hypothetical protein
VKTYQELLAEMIHAYPERRFAPFEFVMSGQDFIDIIHETPYEQRPFTGPPYFYGYPVRIDEDVPCIRFQPVKP